MTLVSLLALFAALPAPAAPLPPGQYCVVLPMYGHTSHSDFPLGDFWMKVDVGRRGSAVSVRFEDYMPDSEQHLMGHGQARPARDGSVEFAFTDNWYNRGTARLSRDGTITLRNVRATHDFMGKNVLRNYGTFHVTKRGCAAQIRKGPYVNSLEGYTVWIGEPRR